MPGEPGYDAPVSPERRRADYADGYDAHARERAIEQEQAARDVAFVRRWVQQHAVPAGDRHLLLGKLDAIGAALRSGSGRS